MTSPFENLTGPGKALRAEPPDAKEFAGLLRSGESRLKDAGNTSLSLESRFGLGYNAAHAFCLAALRWHGYRSSKSVHRVPAAAAHARARARGVAGPLQVPRRAQPW